MATVKELKAQAKAKGIKGYSTMKKAELEKALGGSETKPPPKSPKKAPAKKAFKIDPQKLTNTQEGAEYLASLKLPDKDISLLVGDKKGNHWTFTQEIKAGKEAPFPTKRTYKINLEKLKSDFPKIEKGDYDNLSRTEGGGAEQIIRVAQMLNRYPELDPEKTKKYLIKTYNKKLRGTFEDLREKSAEIKGIAGDMFVDVGVFRVVGFGLNIPPEVSPDKEAKYYGIPENLPPAPVSLYKKGGGV